MDNNSRTLIWREHLPLLTLSDNTLPPPSLPNSFWSHLIVLLFWWLETQLVCHCQSPSCWTPLQFLNRVLVQIHCRLVRGIVFIAPICCCCKNLICSVADSTPCAVEKRKPKRLVTFPNVVLGFEISFWHFSFNFSVSPSLFPDLETLSFARAPEQFSADLLQSLDFAIEKSMYPWLFVDSL